MTATTLPAPPVATRSEARRGAAAMAPLLLGYAPFALTVGTAVAASPDPVAGWAGTLLIFGGSAQLAVVQSVGSGAAAVVAIATGLLVHSRLLVYGVSIAPRWAHQPRRFRWIAAATLIDPLWALAADRAPGGDPVADRHHHLGAALTLGLGWTAMVTLGVVVGPGLTDGLGLEVAAPLCLLALLVPRTAERPGRAAAVAAGLVAMAAHGLPGGTGLLAAIAAGVAAGVLSGGSRS